jgi:hypothetical protein
VNVLWSAGHPDRVGVLDQKKPRHSALETDTTHFVLAPAKQQAISDPYLSGLTAGSKNAATRSPPRSEKS